MLTDPTWTGEAAARLSPHRFLSDVESPLHPQAPAGSVRLAALRASNLMRGSGDGGTFAV